MKSTEEETFKRLKKATFEEMYLIRFKEYPGELLELVPVSLFNKYGWTVDEYFNELRRRKFKDPRQA